LLLSLRNLTLNCLRISDESGGLLCECLGSLRLGLGLLRERLEIWLCGLLSALLCALLLRLLLLLLLLLWLWSRIAMLSALASTAPSCNGRFVLVENPRFLPSSVMTLLPDDNRLVI
jgi:hypothetical protein